MSMTVEQLYWKLKELREKCPNEEVRVYTEQDVVGETYLKIDCLDYDNALLSNQVALVVYE